MSGLHIPLDVPDLWQQEAIRALREGGDVIVDAPTGAGKTRVFEAYVESGDAAKRGQAVFTVPTRALANDKWREWKSRGWRVGIATGDVAVDIHAPVLVATLETQRERILARRPPAILVIDEYQMLADPRRGLNYELALALCPPSTQLLLLSGSVRNPADIADWLARLGRAPRLVRETHRPVPLEELPVENLPRVPDAVTGFWPRLAAGALLAGLTPLLIFAPRRAEAEKIARKIADALPLEDAIPLRPDDERLLGRDLARLVQKRVAYHHSGLPYAARAGWVETLAKNGHLRVIVATTGLAAGINFSVRSVLVADTTYHDGPFQRELRPDELLQMFGRAGRRGLDPRGVVLVARNSPRLGNAAPRQLRRVNELDWPTLLRVMEEAAARDESPPAAAAALGRRLFSRQSVGLGFDEAGAESASPERFGPTREEFLDSTNEWRPFAEAREKNSPLAECLARRRDRWEPALRVAAVAERFGPGRLCKLPTDRGFVYGKELVVARQDGDRLRPAEWIQKKLHLRAEERFDAAEFLATIAPLLDLGGARAIELVARGPMVALRLELGGISVPALVDPRQRALLEAPRRRVAVANETAYGDFQPRAGTPAHAWRKLGLVDGEGRPTARGRVFSRFQAGEGLMIAAALEDPHYDVGDLVRHLANLRGGYRFQDEEREGASERLAVASRAVYGHVDHEGYLRTGLCEGYGPGAWETIERHLAGKLAADPVVVSRGDIERAVLEWKSLLRHIVHAPDADAPRWRELQAAADACLKERGDHFLTEVDLPTALLRRAAERPIRLAALTD